MKLPSFLAFIILLSTSYAQNISVLQSYSLNEGLSQSVVNDIIQDDTGFLWIGTQDGLNRFDGYSFKVFSRRFDRTSGLKSGYITKLHIDEKKRFWIGTIDGGMHLFDLNTEKFESVLFKINNDSTFNIVVQNVREFKNTIFVGTKSNGLFYYDEQNHLFVQYKPENMARLNVRDILIENHYMYLATSSGLHVLDLNTDIIKQYLPDSNSKDAINHHSLNNIFLDSQNRLWIGTIGFGLNIFDAKSEKFSSIKSPNLKYNIESAFVNDIDEHEDELYISTDEALYLINFNSISEYQIHAIKSNQKIEFINSCYFDNTGNMWLGSWGNGIQKRRHNYKRFDYIGKFNNELIQFGSLFSLTENDDFLVIGSQGNGISIYEKPHYRKLKSRTSILANEDIYHLKIYDDNLFIGTYERGLFIYNLKSHRLKNYKHKANDENSLSSNIINEFVREDQNKFWIASSNGINLFDLKKESFKRYHFNVEDGVILDKGTIKLLKQKNNLWVGTDGDGLLKFNIETESFTRYVSDFNKTNSISDNVILSLHLDHDNILWIGTDGGGLNFLNTMDEEKGFQSISKKDGLVNNVIYGILEDKNHYLWLSTNLGLTKMHRKSFDIRIYDERDGLQSNEFNQNAYFQNKDGLMYFGGIKGLNSFYPEDVVDNRYLSKIIFTDIKISGKSVFSKYKKNKLKFSYNDDIISFEFVNLDLTSPEKNKYAYKLTGFNEEWVDLGKVHFATFTNLNAGDYEFRVKASNNDGIWNEEELSYRFHIAAPFWSEIWFIALIIILCIVFVYSIVRYRINRVTRRNLELEAIVKKRTEEIETKAHIISSINQKLDLHDLLKSILREIGHINESHRMSFLTYNKEKELFLFDNIEGQLKEELENLEFTTSEVEAFFKNYFNEIEKNCFVLRSDLREDFAKKVNFSLPSCMYAMMIERNNRVEAVMILERFDNQKKYTDKEVKILNGLKDHIELAFIKLRLLEELKILNDNKNMFLGIVAHDLRNPLTKIAGYVSLIGEYIKEGNFSVDSIMKDVDLVLTTTDKMSALIRDLLDFSAIESGNVNLKLEEINFNEVLDLNIEYFQRIAEQKNIQFDVDKASFDELPKLRMDKFKMSEVIDNLLSNAIKYTYEKGKISIRAEKRKDDVCVYVTDSGQGLSSEDQKDVFKTFQTLSAKPTAGESSTGLGLAIAKKIVNLHGGNIGLESEVNKGSTFYFTLKLN